MNFGLSGRFRWGREPRRDVPSLSRRAASREEPEAIADIPYFVPVAPSTVKTVYGTYVRTWRITGMPWLTASVAARNEHHLALRKLLDGLTAEQVVYTSHMVRSRVDAPPAPAFPREDFAAEFSRAYHRTLAKGAAYANEHYLSLEYVPASRRVERLLPFLSMKTSEEDDGDAAARRTVDAIGLALEHALAALSPVALGTYRHGDVMFSRQLEFYAFLANGDRRRVPFVMAPIQETLLTSRTLFAMETGELRASASTRFVAALGVKQYPDRIVPGILSRLFGNPAELVLTQSYAPLPRAAAMKRAEDAVTLDRQVEARAKSQQAEIEAGGEGTLLDDLESGRYGLGECHLSLFVRTTEPKALERDLANIVPRLDELGFRTAREDFALEGAHWAQLPGQDPGYRPRPDTLTSGNAAGMMSFVGEWKGSRDGNKWGGALVALRTMFGEFHDFNLHVKDVGHSIILGPTGSGKTTAQLFIAAMLSRYGAKQVFFDYGRGSEVFCYAMGGKFTGLRIGEPSGFNPFRIGESPKHVLLATAIVRRLCEKTGGPLSQRLVTQLENAVATVFRLPLEQRRLSRVIDSVDRTSQDGIDKRLARWVEGGPMAWLWDNESDVIDFERPITGFDIKHFIDDDEIRPEVMMYLFHRLGDIVGKGRVAVYLGEFWKALDDPYFSDWIEAFLNTARKDDAVFVGETQSPEKVAESDIAHVVINQTATKIYLWNRDADRDTYVGRFGLSEEEYGWVRNLGRERMLVKQKDGVSVVLGLDLGAPELAPYLAVLSGTTEAAHEVELIRNEVGDDPRDWRPIWNKRRGYD